MTRIRHFILAIVSVATIALAVPLQAQANTPPDQIVEQLTVEMLAAIKAAKSTFADDPEPFYKAIEDIVMPRMDIRSFARGVMGQYGSTSYYRSLQTDSQREQFKQRILTFADVFKHSIVRTYSKGLMTFSGQTIALVPVTDEQKAKIAAGDSLELLQVIESSDSDPHELRYSFARSRDGEWLVRNLLVDGINLGKVYQSQFTQAVKDSGGDVDKAIKNWAVSDELNAAKTES